MGSGPGCSTVTGAAVGAPGAVYGVYVNDVKPSGPYVVVAHPTPGSCFR